MEVGAIIDRPLFIRKKPHLKNGGMVGFGAVRGRGAPRAPVRRTIRRVATPIFISSLFFIISLYELPFGRYFFKIFDTFSFFFRLYR